jgi:hypothetical protein
MFKPGGVFTALPFLFTPSTAKAGTGAGGGPGVTGLAVELCPGPCGSPGEDEDAIVGGGEDDDWTGTDELEVFWAPVCPME